MLAAILAACRTLEDKDAAYYQIPEGSRLVLHQQLQIPANAARIAIQSGQVRRYRLVNEFYPYCELEVKQVKSTPQSLKPDEFLIQQVRRRVYSVGLSPDATAATGLTSALSINNGDGPRQTFYATIFYLHSDRQPKVLKLTCESDQRAFPGIIYARHLTISEIQTALGAVLTLHVDRHRTA